MERGGERTSGIQDKRWNLRPENAVSARTDVPKSVYQANKTDDRWTIEITVPYVTVQTHPLLTFFLNFCSIGDSSSFYVP